MEQALLEVRNLNVYYADRRFRRGRSRKQILRDVSFTLHEGEVLGLVGESGCGKTTLSRAILGINREIEVEIIHHGGKPRMVFQDPAASLNPAWTVGKILEEPLRNAGVPKQERRAQAEEMLSLVGLDAGYYSRLPGELSGGQRQRVGIGAAIIGHPRLVIADEPVSALDVTIQAQILDLLKQIQEKLGTATILVSHDLGVVARAADRVAIMYAGKIVEIGTAEEVYYDPRHPYTWGLMQSLPALNKGASELKTIPGMPPTLIDPPEGDAFACRNPYALEIDYAQQPPMFQISDTHFAATWLLDPRAPKITPTIGGNAHV